MRKRHAVAQWMFAIVTALWTTSRVLAGDNASHEVKKRLADALRDQIPGYVATMPIRGPALGEAAVLERQQKMAESLFKEGLARYNSVFAIAEPDAQLLLQRGPDDAANLAALARNWEIYKKVELPLPTLMKYLHEQVEVRRIDKGWDLEMVRRVSDSHLETTIAAQKRYEESQKTPPRQ